VIGRVRDCAEAALAKLKSEKRREKIALANRPQRIGEIKFGVRRAETVKSSICEVSPDVRIQQAIGDRAKWFVVSSLATVLSSDFRRD